MKNYPVTVVDDFLENPELLRAWAETLKFNPSDGAWPGSRTSPISVLSFDIFKTIVLKLNSLFYDLEQCYIEWDEIEMEFQMVEPFAPTKNDPRNAGWIHEDDSIYSGVIYLNRDFSSGTGTSIYAKKPDFIQQGCDLKFPFYRGEEVDTEEYIQELKKNNDQYIESIRVENKFNRLILFEGGVPHGVPTFWTDRNEPRLTLVFFAKKMSVTGSPTPCKRAGVSISSS